MRLRTELPAGGDDDLVEVPVVLDERRDVACAAGCLHLREVLLELGEDGPARGPHRARGPLLDDDARLEDVAGLVGRERDDEGALLGVEPDEALDLESQQRLADGGP